jgi:hypothetical protein
MQQRFKRTLTPRSIGRCPPPVVSDFGSPDTVENLLQRAPSKNDENQSLMDFHSARHSIPLPHREPEKKVANPADVRKTIVSDNTAGFEAPPMSKSQTDRTVARNTSHLMNRMAGIVSLGELECRLWHPGCRLWPHGPTHHSETKCRSQSQCIIGWLGSAMFTTLCRETLCNTGSTRALSKRLR